jgi:tetratricopeptide (TPR) repeat protein
MPVRIRVAGCLLTAFCLAFGSARAADPEGTIWEQYVKAAKEAYQGKDYDGCVKLLHSALAEAEKGGSEDPRVAVTLHNLANLAAARQRYAEAEQLELRALGILEKTRGPSDVRVAVAVLGLADLYAVQAKNTEAEAAYQRALAVFERSVGREHAIVATVLERYAALLRKTNRSADAERLEARVHEIREKQTASNGAGSER